VTHFGLGEKKNETLLRRLCHFVTSLFIMRGAKKKKKVVDALMAQYLPTYLPIRITDLTGGVSL